MEKTLITIQPQHLQSSINSFCQSLSYQRNSSKQLKTKLLSSSKNQCDCGRQYIKVKDYQGQQISLKKQLKNLRKSYQALWKQVQLIQKENSSLYLQNIELKKKISQINQKSLLISDDQITKIQLVSKTKTKIQNMAFEEKIQDQTNLLEDSRNTSNIKYNNLQSNKIYLTDHVSGKIDQDDSFIKIQQKFKQAIKQKEQQIASKNHITKRLNNTVANLNQQLLILKDCLQKRHLIQNHRHDQILKLVTILNDW